MGSWSEDATGVVTLVDGRRVRGRALSGVAPVDGDLPEFGLYLTARPHEEQRWESQWISWPDFRLPRSAAEALTALRGAYERSASSRVEIACDGGNGRTGTAIAILARHAGVPGGDAVRWVRENYRPGAVETPAQRRFVASAELDVPR